MECQREMRDKRTPIKIADEWLNGWSAECVVETWITPIVHNNTNHSKHVISLKHLNALRVVETCVVWRTRVLFFFSWISCLFLLLFDDRWSIQNPCAFSITYENVCHENTKFAWIFILKYSLGLRVRNTNEIKILRTSSTSKVRFTDELKNDRIFFFEKKREKQRVVFHSRWRTINT